MSEVAAGGSVGSPPAGSSAGALLRAARQGQGLHIAALAASLKVPQAKLEALEADRFEELPDPTFARALAGSVCRVLKIDPAPVMQRLPSGVAARLERVTRGLNTPLRERAGGGVHLFDTALWRVPAFWLVLVFLGGAVVMVLTPAGWFASLGSRLGLERGRVAAVQPAESTAISSALPASALAGGIVERVNAAVAAASEVLAPSDPTSIVRPGTSPATEPNPVPAQDAVTRLRAVEATWVQVTDSHGQILLSRLLAAGEVVGLSETSPLRLRIGNAHGTELTHRGQRIDLAPSTRDNVATVELQ